MDRHESVTEERVLEMAQSSMFGTCNDGICFACGAEQGGCEPDARNYKCDNCGASEVFGAEEAMIMIV